MNLASKISAFAASLIASSLFAWEIPASKDASLIQNSLCCGSNAADRNFGSGTSVDAGRYHHNSRALFGFNLVGLKTMNALQKVELVLPSVSTVGSASSSAAFALGVVVEDWVESEVTYNNAPSSEAWETSGTFLGGDLRFDVTEIVQAAVLSGKESISLVIDAVGSLNLFVPSRENTNQLPWSYLELSAAQ